ncbi:MAG: sodium:solute symporter family protein [Thermovirgaceae bacterium]|nr:sodium:solute symporter family protein [Thermovirgaceae bacterium]
MTIFAASAVLTMAVFIAAGIWFGRKSRSFCDYSMAGRECGTLGVSGVLLGSLVGGASTVGTVQMAYQWGLSAWWFTLGGGLGCLVLGIWFAVPLRRSGMETIPGFISLSYGRATGNVAVLASVTGTFISIVAQFLSGAALLRGAFPAPGPVSVLLVGVLVLSFIFMGGLKSFSAIGVGKIALLYLTLAICAAASVRGLLSFPGTPVRLPMDPFLNLFGQGIGKGLCSGLSLITGVLCTQIYIQAVFSASTPETARKGALLSALLMPPLGILGIIVGLGMRKTGVVVESSAALSHFIGANFNPWLGGLLWGGILITVIGTAAGLTLGVATNLVSDLLASSINLKGSEKGQAWATRIVVLMLVISSGIIGSAGQGSMILKWSYLSMGLRASGTFFPLAASVLAPERLSPNIALLSGVAGLMTTVLWPLAKIPPQPLFAGLAVSAIIAMTGISCGSGKKPLPQDN